MTKPAKSLSERALGLIRGNVLGVIAIFIALCGTAVALPAHTRVSSRDIVNGSIRAVDISPNAVTSPKVADDSLTGKDVSEDTLDFGDDEGFIEEDPLDPIDPTDPLDPAARSTSRASAAGVHTCRIVRRGQKTVLLRCATD